MEFDIFYYDNNINTNNQLDNPRYIMSLAGVNELLTRIIEKPTCKEEIVNQELLHHLLHIDVFRKENGMIKINIPVILESDLLEIQRIISGVASQIVERILSKKDHIEAIIKKVQNGFSIQRNLYHIICGEIFDGIMFDYLEEKKLVTTSKIHSTQLDYLMILYEKSPILDQHSNRLLCSFNRLNTPYGTFTSFGDNNGDRLDFYRYLRRKEMNLLDKECIIDFDPNVLAKHFNDYLEGNTLSKEDYAILEYFGYIHHQQIMIPIYQQEDLQLANDIYQFIIDDISIPIKQALSMIADANLYSVKNGVEILDIANEIYHLIFGEVNELLVQKGFVSQVEYKINQGRYLQAYEIRR